MKLGGHATTVSQLTFSPQGKFIFTSSEGDRLNCLAVHKCGASALIRFDMPVPPVRISARDVSGSDNHGDDTFHVLAVSNDGSINMWGWDGLATRAAQRKAAKEEEEGRRKRRGTTHFWVERADSEALWHSHSSVRLFTLLLTMTMLAMSQSCVDH